MSTAGGFWTAYPKLGHKL